MCRLISSLVAAGLCGVLGYAAENGPSPNQGSSEKTHLRTTVEKRVWLREQMVQGLRDARQIRDVQAKLDRLGPKHIDNLVNAVLAQQLPQPDPQQVLQEARQELARARALRRLLEDEYLAWLQGRAPVVGYAPVIQWLPQGTQLGASAIVSPDRRYARISAMPFFSSIGPVYTYNWATGETRLLPEYGYPSTGPTYPPNGYAYDHNVTDQVKPPQQAPQRFRLQKPKHP